MNGSRCIAIIANMAMMAVRGVGDAHASSPGAGDRRRPPDARASVLGDAKKPDQAGISRSSGTLHGAPDGKESGSSWVFRSEGKEITMCSARGLPTGGSPVPASTIRVVDERTADGSERRRGAFGNTAHPPTQGEFQCSDPTTWCCVPAP